MRPDAYIPHEDPGFAGPIAGAGVPGWIRPVTLVVVLALLGAGIAAWTARMPGHRWEHDLAAGLNDAGAAGKPVFAFFTADWCPPCRELKRGVLGDAKVMAGLEQRYVLVKVDLTNSGGPNAGLAQQFSVRGIPTIILMDSRGTEFDRNTGGGSAMDSWIRRMAGDR